VVKRVKRQELMRWHKAHFAPDNAFLVVAGSIPSERVAAAAAKTFGTWKGKASAPEQSSPPPTIEQRRVVIVDRPESVQSMIYYGNLALPRAHEDFIPLTVANQVLGGSASSRLFMDLREKRSLTYGAYSDVEERVRVAPFLATAAVRTEVTDQAVAAFTEHLERIVAEPAAAPELADSKRYLTDRFPLRIETAGKIAQLVADLRVFGLPDDYWDSFRERIEAVSAQAALGAAQRHVRPKRSLLVVVGKATAIKPGLEAYGPVTVVDTDGNASVTPEMAKQPSAQTAPAAAPAPAASPAATPAKAK
jgi:predicted Zn-dependent peptidase